MVAILASTSVVLLDINVGIVISSSTSVRSAVTFRSATGRANVILKVEGPSLGMNANPHSVQSDTKA